jgi:hypothetical protein
MHREPLFEHGLHELPIRALVAESAMDEEQRRACAVSVVGDRDTVE